MADDHDWMTLHRVRFPEIVSGVNKPMQGPENAKFWRFAPSSLVGPKGYWTYRNDSWGGFATHSTREEAETVFDNPKTHLPFLDRAVEAWHALVIPYAHRGSVQWGDVVQKDSAIKIAPVDPKGPLVVLTTGGYTDPGPEDKTRIKAFIAGIVDVIDYYGTLPGSLRRGIFWGDGVDGREGCTMSLWRDDIAMTTAAYKGGVHRSLLDHHKSSALFDRSSFTRGRILTSKGTWGGTDPVDDIKRTQDHS